jgi:NADPH-dependent 2,4-dienoyl-CoA reductase/sulfur reductase-like enzyme
MVRAGEFVSIRCRVNAALGYDQDYEIRPAQKKKRVLIVGGGPAGMEAAGERLSRRIPSLRLQAPD